MDTHGGLVAAWDSPGAHAPIRTHTPTNAAARLAASVTPQQPQQQQQQQADQGAEGVDGVRQQQYSDATVPKEMLGAPPSAGCASSDPYTAANTSGITSADAALEAATAANTASNAGATGAASSARGGVTSSSASSRLRGAAVPSDRSGSVSSAADADGGGRRQGEDASISTGDGSISHERASLHSLGVSSSSLLSTGTSSGGGYVSRTASGISSGNVSRMTSDRTLPAIASRGESYTSSLLSPSLRAATSLAPEYSSPPDVGAVGVSGADSALASAAGTTTAASSGGEPVYRAKDAAAPATTAVTAADSGRTGQWSHGDVAAGASPTSTASRSSGGTPAPTPSFGSSGVGPRPPTPPSSDGWMNLGFVLLLLYICSSAYYNRLSFGELCVLLLVPIYSRPSFCEIFILLTRSPTTVSPLLPCPLHLPPAPSFFVLLVLSPRQALHFAMAEPTPSRC